MALDRRHCNFCGIMEAVVFSKGDYAAVFPAGHCVGTVANICRGVGCPCFRSYRGFVNRVVCREREKFIPIRDCVSKSYNKSFVIGSFYGEFSAFNTVGNIFVTFDNFEHISVVCAECCGSSAVPCKYKVRSFERITVGPCEAVFKSVCVSNCSVVI